MNKFNPSRGGHLISCNDFTWIQDAFFMGFETLVISLLPEGANQCILSGCNLTVNGINYTITEGFVFAEGEIFKVNASSGTIQGIVAFKVAERPGDLNPVENAEKEMVTVHFVREMELSFDGTSDFFYNENLRLETLILYKLGLEEVNLRLDAQDADLENHSERLEQAEDDIFILQEEVAAVVPIGTIVMTDETDDFDFNTGMGSGLWENWALCDGNNGTPNLRGRFIVGLDPEDTEYDEAGITGGEASVELEEEDIPNHDHEYNMVGDHGTGRNLNGDGNDAYEKTAQDVEVTSSYGGEYFPAVDTREYDFSGSPDQEDINYNPNYGNVISGEYIPAYYETRSHENRPPFYVLAYVKKIN